MLRFIAQVKADEVSLVQQMNQKFKKAKKEKKQNMDELINSENGSKIREIGRKKYIFIKTEQLDSVASLL